MAATIRVSLLGLKMPVAGLRGIEILVDGEIRADLQLGESAALEVLPGQHQIGAILNGVVSRRSKQLSVAVADGDEVNVIGKYSRLWGNLRLSQG